MLWKQLGKIVPDDGRHNKKETEKAFSQTKEWCEECQSNHEIGETEYVASHRLWLCKKCKKTKESK